MPCHTAGVLWCLQVRLKLRETSKAIEVMGKAVETEQEAFSMAIQKVTSIMSTFENLSRGQFGSRIGSLDCKAMHVAPRVEEKFEEYKKKVFLFQMTTKKWGPLKT